MLLNLALTTLVIILVVDLFTGFRLVKSVFNIFVKKKDEIVEAVRDPEADAHAAIQSVKQRREQAVEKRKSVLSKIENLKLRIKKENKNIENFENLAKLAGKAKNADDVREALNLKNSAIERRDSMTVDLNDFQKTEDELENLIKECDNLIIRAEDQKERLVAQLEKEQFRKEIASVLKDNSGESRNALAQLENDVLAVTAQANAAEELAGENKSLEDKYSQKPVVSEDEVNKYLS